MEKMVDIHCHILPGVDDGAADLSETRALLRRSYSQGVRTMIATPHLRIGMFETPADEIYEAFVQTREAAKEIDPSFEVVLGCEFHSASSMIEILKKDPSRTLAGTRYVLTEFSYGTSFSEIRQRTSELLQHGYRPIVAHVERIGCMNKDISLVEELQRMGVSIQVNADSIMGENGRLVKGFCKKLIKRELVQLIGSDAHDCKERVPNLGPCKAFIEKKFGQETARMLLFENPMRLLANEYL